MKRRLVLTLMLALTLLSTAGAAAYLLPINRDIGQIVEAEEGTVEQFSRQALQEEYSLAWMDRYVPVGIQQGFAYTWANTLSTLLPASMVQIGAPVKRGSRVEVPFCVLEPTYRWGTLIWLEEAEGQWALLSLAIEPTL
jgi:hypothetical protein